jgi:hypothetical protein
MGQVGQLSAVIYCKQHSERVLVGRHRTESKGGLDSVQTKEFDVDELARKLGISHEVAEITVITHGNVQRAVKKSETKQLVMSAARLLEGSGLQQEKIAKRLSDILPFSHHYILRLLPKKFKQAKYAVSPGRPRMQDANVNLGKRSEGSVVSQDKGESLDELNDIVEVQGGLDDIVTCAGCKRETTRAKTKLARLCENCRRMVGVTW